jgi:cysteinyl-tRNA synthetase
VRARRPLRRRTAALALGALPGALVVAALASCSASDGPATPAVHPTLERVETFVLGLGVDPADPAARVRLGAHDLVVVDGETAPADVAALQQGGSIVLGYLSVGTVEPYRDWFEEARDEGWLLDRWEDWDEWYADLREPGLRDRLVDEASAVLDAGFDGLFLDNVDAVDLHPEQAEPTIELVARLREVVGDDRLLFSQNGDPLALGIGEQLDGWNLEDVHFTYDREADGYVPVDDAQRVRNADRLRAVRATGVLVTGTDYLAGTDPELVDEGVELTCAAGAVPFVADLELTEIPDPPLRCG